MWRDLNDEWLERIKEKPTLVVRMEDFKMDCEASLTRLIGFLEVTLRPERIKCACARDHATGAKREGKYSPDYTPEMLEELESAVGEMMGRFGYDMEQSKLGAVPEFGLKGYILPESMHTRRKLPVVEEEEERRREEMERQDREKAARLMEEERLLARDKAQQRRLQNDRLLPPSPPPPSPPPPVKVAEGTMVEEIRQYQQA